MSDYEDDYEDDLPLDTASVLRDDNQTAFSRALRQYQTHGTFWVDAPTTYAAIVQLISSNDPASGEMLNYMFESGIPRRFDLTESKDMPISVCAALAWSSPAYTDILATLMEFEVDFDEMASLSGQSARGILDARAPGLYGLIRLQAHLVASGAWPDYKQFGAEN